METVDTMYAPTCKLCKAKHWPSDPHKWPKGKEPVAAPVEQPKRKRVNAPSVDSDAEVSTTPTDILPPAVEAKPKGSRTDYMREYQRKRRAAQRARAQEASHATEV